MPTTTDTFSWFPASSGARHSSTTSTSSKDYQADLDTALQKITTAVSRLHRCGETFKAKSEAFWIFCAGSWTRNKYEEEVDKANNVTTVGGNGVVSVEEDLRLALGEVLDAVRILRRGGRDGDERDADALMEAVDGSGIWEGRGE
ncbi:hypothetical protein AC578_7366 [Pseudocercospora eumusae]|uniref:Uncharacterized protein n=1 Tax=Pseudocercospora eumusae TaxID=321146 RepID=A0A139H4Y1_9PEZI|nr:hypothetical protein AC578_7366 [Pseudocercospora eumusae]